MDSLGWQVESIPLQTSDSVLIKDIYIFKESVNFYFIVSDNKIFKFDKKGGFVSYIGQSGQGPQEFIGARQIHPDDRNEHLYVMDYFGRKMIIYKYNGEFVSSFPLPDDYLINSFYMYKNDIYYLSTTNSIMPDLFRYSVTSNMLDTICKREREMGSEGPIGESYIYEFDDSIRFFHYFNDTVYSMKEDNLYPCYLVSFEKKKYKFEELQVEVNNGNIKQKINPDGLRIQVSDFFETSRYICIFYSYSGEASSYIFDKEGKKGYPNLSIKSDKAPYTTIKHGEHFFYSKQSDCVFQIKESHELAKFFDNISEDDNPIIIKYHSNVKD